MLYDIKLSIRYDYGGPSMQARNVLRVMPMNRAGEQRLLMGEVSFEPRPQERFDRTDFFGNAITEVGFHQPLSRLTVCLRARVERTARAPQLDLSPDLPRLAQELAGLRSVAAQSPHHFLAASPRVALDQPITEFVAAALPEGATVLAAVRDVGRALKGEMRFDPAATEVDTLPAESFANRHGVCQDFSHVMIAGLRAHGIPAGYVSGFLRTEPPEGQPRLSGADAMHAWVRVWCGAELGWVEYDPTNDLMVGADHVAVAMGRDYSDVAPVKGAVLSSGGQKSSHAVDMVPLVG